MFIMIKMMMMIIIFIITITVVMYIVVVFPFFHLCFLCFIGGLRRVHIGGCTSFKKKEKKEKNNITKRGFTLEYIPLTCLFFLRRCSAIKVWKEKVIVGDVLYFSMGRRRRV